MDSKFPNSIDTYYTLYFAWAFGP